MNYCESILRRHRKQEKTNAKLRDEVDRMEIAALAVVFLARIFHLLSVVVSERYAEHSGIILSSL